MMIGPEMICIRVMFILLYYCLKDGRHGLPNFGRRASTLVHVGSINEYSCHAGQCHCSARYWYTVGMIGSYMCRHVLGQLDSYPGVT